MPVNGPLGHTGRGRDLADGDRSVTLGFGEQFERGVDQAFLGFFAAVGRGRGQGVAAVHEVGQDRFDLAQAHGPFLAELPDELQRVQVDLGVHVAALAGQLRLGQEAQATVVVHGARGNAG
jgi:hypothetical protein